MKIRWTTQKLVYKDKKNDDPNYFQNSHYPSAPSNYLPPPKICRFLGTILRQAREIQGLSTSQIYTKTRISRCYIEAIDAGNFELLPGGLFLRCFIKAYADCVNLDKDAVMLVFLGKILINSDAEEIEPFRQINDVPLENTAYEQPPEFAEYLLYFLLTKSERVNLIGDLTEEYKQILSKFGIKKARYWYFKQVFDSLWPLIKRLIQKTGFYTSIAEIIRRLIN